MTCNNLPNVLSTFAQCFSGTAVVHLQKKALKALLTFTRSKCFHVPIPNLLAKLSCYLETAVTLRSTAISQSRREGSGQTRQVFLSYIYITAVSHNANGGNLVWFGNRERGTRILRGNGLARCFSLFLFGDYSK